MNLQPLHAARDLALAPLSWAWEGVHRLRRSGYEYGFFRRANFRVPVISVGNLTFGGTGKTPMILWLADHLASRGLTPVVLTRGYRGALEHGAGVLKSGQRFRLNPHDYGDEPLMIAGKMKKGAVIVGKERGRNLERYFPEVQPDVVLLDDGFQHLQINRAFNIVLFDATMPLSRYKTAPRGYLREGLSALKDADAVVFSRADLANQAQKDALKGVLERHYHHHPVMGEVAYRPIGLFDGFDTFQARAEELRGRDVVALTAIASPSSFYRTLEGYGARLVERMSFPDHYYFTHLDVNDILLRATRHGAMVVCSEKDMVKLRRVSQDPRLLFLKVQTEFLSGEDGLKEAIGKVLHLAAPR